ncbi:hypothetical protein [uncultured Clostridium sp.]|uniref:hypothetical protein n=1 Tax=uncultured Clostridium sp. TaxID=59620 RepID=UPI00261EF79A|nr:hypothetical protein [uncultured Clostridium sp.]
MKKLLTESKLRQVMDWSYDKAINGFKGMEGADELARNYLIRIEKGLYHKSFVIYHL